uniref:Uncharacterized protein n=1 Tax=Anolis carolinensis TaxID=28377 RepID=A0A803TT49_ANOCA
KKTRVLQQNVYSFMRFQLEKFGCALICSYLTRKLFFKEKTALSPLEPTKMDQIALIPVETVLQIILPIRQISKCDSCHIIALPGHLSRISLMEG